MKLKTALKLLKQTIKGPFQTAIDDGLRAGKGVTVMSGVSFGSEPYLISLGDEVRISSNVLFVTHDGGTWAFRKQPEFRDVVKYDKIEIGDGAFICANSTILPGVTIGHHAVVGAGSVVCKNIPPETVWAGVPARQICTLRDYAERTKAAMPEDFDFTAYKKDKKSYLTEFYGMK